MSLHILTTAQNERYDKRRERKKKWMSCYAFYILKWVAIQHLRNKTIFLDSIQSESLFFSVVEFLFYSVHLLYRSYSLALYFISLSHT